jgi:hypothetical protein
MIMARRIVFLMMLNLGTFAWSQPPANFRIFPSIVTQTEPVAVVSPVNPQFMFVSARTINTNPPPNNGIASEGVYVSTDGGVHWFGSDTCRGELLTNHGGDPGIAITPGGRLILTHIGSVFTGVYGHYSTNLGAQWSNAATIFSHPNYPPDDKGSASMDESPTSPYYGRVYKVWSSISSSVSTSFTSDGGQTWSPPVAVVSNPPPPRYSGGSIAVSRSGVVYLTWAVMTIGATPVEDYCGFAVSTNGGVSWSVSPNIFDMNGVFGNLPAAKGSIRVNGLPSIAVDNSTGPRQGWLYILTGEKNIPPAGSDPDVLLHRSTNGGATWSAGIRVNQDALNNGKIQWLPSLEVDDQGGVNVMFYDDRNTTADSGEVWLARSTDGGTTWSERVISDHRFKPKAIAGGPSSYQGDNTSLLAVGRKLFPFWMDDFSGLYQVWTCMIDIGTDDAGEEPDAPRSFALHQNYPNPFNPSTKITFQIPNLKPQTVSLKVYDLLGREVVTLVNENLQPGYYEATFDATGVASGVYFSKLVAGPFVATQKMLLVR